MLEKFLKKLQKIWLISGDILNRIEIYRDNEIKVEIDSSFNNFIQSFIIKTIKLNNLQYHFLIEVALDIIQVNNIKYKGCIVKVSSNAPIIEYNKRLSLIEPFTVFEPTFDLLTLLEDWNSFYEIKNLIIQYYEEKEIPFYIEKFKNPIYNIYGFMAAKYKNELLICFFSIDKYENIIDNY